ncbi:ATP-dependent DNA helicase PIF1-like [Nasonia vitripennis]|uniref:ATP-dependent DNA helicase n=1 Tax=Nasonia vitripennis TaxID=7425 RepID=A0A7M7QCX2_NASVI|nr:ATP-dependent DNA helicase PIF1-like [Nasonia vitripennis]XP_031785673.1 ATP-dependent DNA helicase PIF1-like [Nasonia vitripennis]
MFVSGPEGTGKSFVIKNLVSWNKIYRDKDTAVTAPTGIAAYNVQGLTIHRFLQLPVEHGGTAEYKELSGAALKQIRQTLQNVDLLIIDEISVVSNITFMYIHLRLTEIFDTSDNEDGWFGSINVLVFGDLLQLPPVREDFVFVGMNKKQIDKYIKSMITFNLWELFEYDELTINMRQKNDKDYSEILSQLCKYLGKLPNDTVCLLPTRKTCNAINEAMLLTIDTEEINLVAKDSYKLKIGSKVMIRRNIDVSIGLVNGTIG